MKATDEICLLKDDIKRLREENERLKGVDYKFNELLEQAIRKYIEDNLSEHLRKEKWIIQDIAEEHMTKLYDLTRDSNGYC